MLFCKLFNHQVQDMDYSIHIVHYFITMSKRSLSYLLPISNDDCMLKVAQGKHGENTIELAYEEKI